MKQYLPSTVSIIPSHPLFGPQSIQDNLIGNTIVLSSEYSISPQYDEVKQFLKQKLQLQVVEMTSEEHDKEMAIVQALNHFIVRGLQDINIDITSTILKTPAFSKLLTLYETLRNDSYDLFLTIQKENPYAHDIRSTYLRTLEEIHDSIKTT